MINKYNYLKSWLKLVLYRKITLIVVVETLSKDSLKIYYKFKLIIFN